LNVSWATRSLSVKTAILVLIRYSSHILSESKGLREIRLLPTHKGVIGQRRGKTGCSDKYDTVIKCTRLSLDYNLVCRGGGDAFETGFSQMNHLI
jgi:hypothetical protein